MKPGVHHDMSEKEYRQIPGLNYSKLAQFHESRDHALMTMPTKSFFEFGNAFELMIEDLSKGTEKFIERFFVCNAPGAMPEDLAGWIESGENLNEKYRLKNDGERNNQSKRLHAWLDACQSNPGMMPIGKDELAALETMADNFMKMEIFGYPLSEILPAAKFQVPVIWYVGKVRKKALIDILVEAGDDLFAFDTKTAADIERFQWMLKKKYWIQETHYTQGLRSIFPETQINWMFLVSSKASPYIAQPFCIAESSREAARDTYFDLCTQFAEWDDEGRPPRGWKDLKEVSIFFP